MQGVALSGRGSRCTGKGPKKNRVNTTSTLHEFGEEVETGHNGRQFVDPEVSTIEVIRRAENSARKQRDTQGTMAGRTHKRRKIHACQSRSQHPHTSGKVHTQHVPTRQRPERHPSVRARKLHGRSGVGGMDRAKKKIRKILWFVRSFKWEQGIQRKEGENWNFSRDCSSVREGAETFLGRENTGSGKGLSPRWGEGRLM